MSDTIATQDYFVISARALMSMPETISRLSPKKMLICQSTIDILNNDVMVKGAAPELKALIDVLVLRGAQIVPGKGMSRVVIPGAHTFLDRLHELRNFSEGAGAKHRYFMVSRSLGFRNPKNATVVRRANWQEIVAESRPDLETRKLAREYRDRSQQRLFSASIRLAGNFTLSYLVLVAALFLFRNTIENPTEYPPILILAGVLLAGLALFFWRERSRLSYGMFELLVGMYTSYNVFATSELFPDLNASNPNALIDPTLAYVQIAAGLYVMVRGFDNIGRGLIGTIFEAGWKRFFEGVKTDKPAPDVEVTESSFEGEQLAEAGPAPSFTAHTRRSTSGGR